MQSRDDCKVVPAVVVTATTIMATQQSMHGDETAQAGQDTQHATHLLHWSRSNAGSPMMGPLHKTHSNPNCTRVQLGPAASPQHTHSPSVAVMPALHHLGLLQMQLQTICKILCVVGVAANKLSMGNTNMMGLMACQQHVCTHVQHSTVEKKTLL